PNAECQNLVGGYNCVCQPGYERRGKKGHCKDALLEPAAQNFGISAAKAKILDFFFSLDINECKEMPCHKAAMCYNLPGTFTCTCIEGYSGDGFDCQGQKFVSSTFYQNFIKFYQICIKN
uniref:EGF-like domain-containing protein n=1 Tax=Romanomermis culicivorax TaxID=13658 RepID=A0A915K5K6_ROMCU